jgi:hypothetical protein
VREQGRWAGMTQLTGRPVCDSLKADPMRRKIPIKREPAAPGEMPPEAAPGELVPPELIDEAPPPPLMRTTVARSVSSVPPAPSVSSWPPPVLPSEEAHLSWQSGRELLREVTPRRLKSEAPPPAPPASRRRRESLAKIPRSTSRPPPPPPEDTTARGLASRIGPHAPGWVAPPASRRRSLSIRP